MFIPVFLIDYTVFITFSCGFVKLLSLACVVGGQLLQLLLKASQDKKFVCEEADKALNAMVKSMTPLPLLNKLKPYVSHVNLRIRAKAAISISNFVSKMVKLRKSSIVRVDIASFFSLSIDWY